MMMMSQVSLNLAPLGHAVLTRLTQQVKLAVLQSSAAARPLALVPVPSTPSTVAPQPPGSAPPTPSSSVGLGLDGLAPDHARAVVQHGGRRVHRRAVPYLVVVKLQQRLTRANTEIHKLQRKMLKFTDRAQRYRDRTSAQIVELKKGITDPLAISKIGSQNLNWTSTIAVGVRRNLATISAADFGAVTLLDVSRQTVCRCERLVGQCLIADCIAFFKDLDTGIYVI